MSKKRKQHYNMPMALWRLPNRILNYKQKHLLSFIWWCAPRGCHCWNCRLAKKFNVSDRTIRRWLARLKQYELIAIGFPDGRGRTLWPRYQVRPEHENPTECVEITVEKPVEKL